MKSFSYRPYIHAILPTVLILITAVVAVGQSTVTSEDSFTVNPALRRIERARALAAAHQLQAATAELENIRASVNDVALRNVTTLMLLGIYLEEGNYGRSQSLLEETFQTRGAQRDESIRTYFAAAGQTINGIRSHLARYRSFGLNPSDADLPVEANTDLDRVRALLERVIAQAKEISKEAGRAYDSLALQEDVMGIRLSLARDSEDRAKWQAEYLAARERMASSRIQVASLGRPPALESVTARIPNPFATPNSGQNDATGTAKKDAEPANSPKTDTGPNSSTTSATPSGANNLSDDVPEPKLISTGSLRGRETKRVTPTYPANAKSSSVSGTVRVFAIVDEKGKVWVTNSEGPLPLRKAAEDAARRWSFPPTLVGGKPVRVAGYLDFDFKL